MRIALFLVGILVIHSASSQPTSFEPAPKYEKKEVKKAFIPSSKKGTFDWEWDQQIKEYYVRVKQVEKRNKKWVRISKRPQYSDPSYFGHRRKPKKRKVGKRKFCKECKIVH